MKALTAIMDWVTALVTRLAYRQGYWEKQLALLHAEQPRERWEAAYALRLAPPRSEVALALLEILGDTHPFVRWQAGLALCHQNRAIVMPSLLQALHSDQSTRRASAADILGLLGDGEAVLPLCQALDDPDVLVRCSAAEALGYLQDQTASAPLLLVLTNRQEVALVRRAAAQSLGRLKAREAGRALADCLRNRNEHPLVRRAAAGSLGQIPFAEATEALRLALNDPDPQVRWNAVWALGQVGDESDIPALRKRLTDEELAAGGPVRVAARRALWRLRVRSWSQKLGLKRRPKRT